MKTPMIDGSRKVDNTHRRTTITMITTNTKNTTNQLNQTKNITTVIKAEIPLIIVIVITTSIDEAIRIIIGEEAVEVFKFEINWFKEIHLNLLLLRIQLIKE